MVEKYKYLKLMQNITDDNLPSLAETVLGGLELFIKEGVPKLELPKIKNLVIAGSGNAYATANLLFPYARFVLDENNYKTVLDKFHNEIDGVIVFSASGSKHAPIIAKESLKYNINTYGVTCTKSSDLEKVIGKNRTIVTKKNPEPYTYNTSTYLGWILSFTNEKPEKIYKFITEKVDKSLKDVDLGLYDGFLLALPNNFETTGTFLNTKFLELFGRQVSRDVFTYEHLKHAVTVVPSKSELAIQFGEGDFYFKGDKLKIPIYKGIDYGGFLFISYYVIGKIQEQKKQYFKENIKDFIKALNKTSFGKNLKVIVK